LASPSKVAASTKQIAASPAALLHLVRLAIRRLVPQHRPLHLHHQHLPLLIK